MGLGESPKCSVARRHTRSNSLQTPCFLLSLQPQDSKEALKAETWNISTSFEDLDAQVRSDMGYSPEDAKDTPGTEAPGVPRGRLRLSTQMVYELKTKLRCSREKCSLAGGGGADFGAKLQAGAWGPQTPLSLCYRSGK